MKRFRLAAAATAVAGLGAAIAVGPMSPDARAHDAAEDHPGKVVFDYWCAPCHDPGPGHPGTQGLEIKYRGTGIPAELEARTDLTPPVVETFVRQGVLAMAPFHKTEITDAELAELADYLAK